MGEILTDELLQDFLKYLFVYLLTAITSGIGIVVKMYFDVRSLKKDTNNAFNAIRQLRRWYGRNSEDIRKIGAQSNYGEVFQEDDSSDARGSCEED